jgi:hypothetical protein
VCRLPARAPVPHPPFCKSAAVSSSTLAGLPPWRKPRDQFVGFLINSHVNANRIRWHLWEIDLRFAPGLPPGRCLCARPVGGADSRPPALSASYHTMEVLNQSLKRWRSIRKSCWAQQLFRGGPSSCCEICSWAQQVFRDQGFWDAPPPARRRIRRRAPTQVHHGSNSPPGTRALLVGLRREALARGHSGTPRARGRSKSTWAGVSGGERATPHGWCPNLFLSSSIIYQVVRTSPMHTPESRSPKKALRFTRISAGRGAFACLQVRCFRSHSHKGAEHEGESLLRRSSWN